MKQTYLAILFIVMGMSGTAQATGIPTVDIANILQTTTTAMESIDQTMNQVEQISNQINQIRNQVEQIRQLDDQFKAMTGNYNMGALLDTIADRNFRRYVPRTWQETLDLIESGVAVAHQTEMQTAAREAREAGERYSTGDIYDDSDWETAKEYTRQAQKIYTVIGATQTAYDGTEKRFENLEALNGQIDTATDIKAATDLNNRILIENAALSNEVIRQIALNTLTQAQSSERAHNMKAADVRAAQGTLNYSW